MRFNNAHTCPDVRANWTNIVKHGVVKKLHCSLSLTDLMHHQVSMLSDTNQAHSMSCVNNRHMLVWLNPKWWNACGGSFTSDFYSCYNVNLIWALFRSNCLNTVRFGDWLYALRRVQQEVEPAGQIVEDFVAHMVHRMMFGQVSACATTWRVKTASVFELMCTCCCSKCGVYIVYTSLCCLLWWSFIVLVKRQLFNFCSLILLVATTMISMSRFIYCW